MKINNSFIISYFLFINFVPFAVWAEEEPVPRESTAEYQSNAVAADYVLVKYRADLSEKEKTLLFASSAGGSAQIRSVFRSSSGNLRGVQREQVDTYGLDRWIKIPVEAGEDIALVIKQLIDDDRIEAVEPDYELRTTHVPNDPRFSDQWSLHNLGQSGGTPDADIDMVEAWDMALGHRAINVAVVDTGIEYNHTDLRENIWVNEDEIPNNGIDDDNNGYVDDYYGYDFFNNDADPRDDNFHGTHVAGTVAAITDNSIGVSGITQNARLMAVKFLGRGGWGSNSSAATAIRYAVDNGAHIINASWGGGGYSQLLFDAISYANEMNVLFVASAGNSNRNNDDWVSYPANYDLPNIISVAATANTDQLAFFSNYGLNSVEIAAPGVNVLSTSLSDGYRYASGTSMAAPHVSGVAAQLASQSDEHSHVALIRTMMVTGDPLASLANRVISGSRLNANQAVSCDDRQLYTQTISIQDGFVEQILQPKIIKVALNTCVAPVTDAEVLLTMGSGSTLHLFDDGEHEDGAANDGVYGVTWTPMVQGEETLSFTIRHQDYSEHRFSLSGEIDRGYIVVEEEYEWIDASLGTRHFLSDDSSASISLGFDFEFYGQTYSQVNLSSNGFLSFLNSALFFTANNSLPSATVPNALIAPFWDDLHPWNGRIYSYTEGEAPNRRFTATWENTHRFGYRSLGTITFQATLYEGSNDIVLRYQDVLFGSSLIDAGASATIGIENQFGTLGLQYGFNEAILENQSAIRITKNYFEIDINGPYFGDAGEDIAFDGDTFGLDEGESVEYLWDFGNGDTGGEEDPLYRYDARGIYEVNLNVRNPVTRFERDASTIAFIGPNSLPIAHPGGPYTGFNDQGIEFDSSATVDEDGDELSYHWDFGDGTFSTASSPVHRYLTQGEYVVSLVVNDGYGDSDVAQTVVSIENRAPIAVISGELVGEADEPLTLNAFASYDEDGDSLEFIWDFGDGLFATGPDVNHTYERHGLYTVQLVATDGRDVSVAANVVVTIGPNETPIANAGGPYEGVIGQPVVFDGSHSTDADGDVLSFLWDFGDGSWAEGESPQNIYAERGTYVVSVTVKDGFEAYDGFEGSVAETTVTIVNRAPIAVLASSPYITLNESITFDATTSHDADGDELSYEWDFGDGTVSTQAVIEHQYTQEGEYTVTLKVFDGEAYSEQVESTVVVNRMPEAVADAYTLDEDTSLEFDVLHNDTDSEQDVLTIVSHSEPAHGSLELSQGVFRYSPATHFNGGDSFQYTLEDQHGERVSAVVSLVINPINDAPKSSDSISISGDEDSFISSILSVIDVDGDALLFDIESTPANGEVAGFNYRTGEFSYRGNEHYYGDDQFILSVSDNTETTFVTVLVSVNPVNDAPTAQNQSYTAVEDGVLLIENPYEAMNDIEGDALRVVAIHQPKFGVAVLTNEGQVRYMPQANFFGDDEFAYTVEDTSGAQAVTVVKVEVLPENDGPTALHLDLSTDEDHAVNTQLALEDIDSSLVAISVEFEPEFGQVEILDMFTGEIRYTPHANQAGEDVFALLLVDEEGAEFINRIRVNVAPVNDEPVAEDDVYVIENNTDTVTINLNDLLLNDIDADNDDISIEGYGDPENGTLITDAEGKLVYTRANSDIEEDYFEYYISDGNGETITGNVTIRWRLNQSAALVEDESAGGGGGALSWLALMLLLLLMNQCRVCMRKKNYV